MKNSKHVQKILRSRKLQILAFVVVFGIVGVAALIISHAASPSVSVESESGTVTAPALKISDASASGGSAIQFTSHTNTSLTKIRGVFYYPWFPEAWNQQGFNPFTNYSPTLGSYSSTDSTVINKHIDEMIYAGMNTAIYSWWGQGSKEDTRLPAFLSATGSKNLKWAIYYECEGNSSGGTCGNIGGPAPSVANIQSDLSYIKTKYASDSHYAYFNGKPVVFVYGDGSDSCTTSANWKTANTNLGSPFYLILKVFGGYASCASQPDNWHQYGPAAAEDVQAGHSIAISPGYWKKGCPQGGGVCSQGDTQPYLARDLTRWQTNVNDLKNSTAPIQLVTTFNEWGEGSSIESASQWSSTSGHGSYIDTLHNTLVSGGTGDTQAPTVPTNLTANAASSSLVNLSWTASTDNVGVTNYEITRNGSVLATINSSATNYADSSVAASTTYTYSVKAIDAAGNKSSASANASATTPASTDTTAPTVPANFNAVVSSATKVDLTWSASTDSGGSGLKQYNIIRNSLIIATVPAGTTSYSDTSALPQTTYTYAVSAQDNASNQSAASNTKTVTTPAVTDTQAPTAPTNLTGSAPSPTQINISWTASTDNVGVAGYQILRNGTLLTTVTTGTSFGDSSLTASTQYSYVVKAKDAAGNISAASNTVTLTTPGQTSGVLGTPCGTKTGNPPATYQYVIWIWMENRNYGDVIGNSNAPVQTELANKCATDPGYVEIGSWVSPTNDTQSLGNYMAATSGLKESQFDSNCEATSCTTTADNLFRQMRAAGISYKSYEEGMPSNCALSGGGTNYAARHNPEAYYVGADDRTACATHNVPIPVNNFTSGAFWNDLNNNTLPRYSFLKPNLINDTHDGSVANGDTWIKNVMPKILASQQYQSGQMAIMFFYDEFTPLPNAMVSPWVIPGTKTNLKYSHYHLLRATEEMLGLTNFLGGAAGATGLRSAYHF